METKLTPTRGRGGRGRGGTGRGSKQRGNAESSPARGQFSPATAGSTRGRGRGSASSRGMGQGGSKPVSRSPSSQIISPIVTERKRGLAGSRSSSPAVSEKSRTRPNSKSPVSDKARARPNSKSPVSDKSRGRPNSKSPARSIDDREEMTRNKPEVNTKTGAKRGRPFGKVASKSATAVSGQQQAFAKSVGPDKDNQPKTARNDEPIILKKRSSRSTKSTAIESDTKRPGAKSRGPRGISSISKSSQPETDDEYQTEAEESILGDAIDTSEIEYHEDAEDGVGSVEGMAAGHSEDDSVVSEPVLEEPKIMKKKRGRPFKRATGSLANPGGRPPVKMVKSKTSTGSPSTIELESETKKESTREIAIGSLARPGGRAPIQRKRVAAVDKANDSLSKASITSDEEKGSETGKESTREIAIGSLANPGGRAPIQRKRVASVDKASDSLSKASITLYAEKESETGKEDTREIAIGSLANPGGRAPIQRKRVAAVDKANDSLSKASITSDAVSSVTEKGKQIGTSSIDSAIDSVIKHASISSVNEEPAQTTSDIGAQSNQDTSQDDNLGLTSPPPKKKGRPFGSKNRSKVFIRGVSKVRRMHQQSGTISQQTTSLIQGALSKPKSGSGATLEKSATVTSEKAIIEPEVQGQTNVIKDALDMHSVKASAATIGQLATAAVHKATSGKSSEPIKHKSITLKELEDKIANEEAMEREQEIKTSLSEANETDDDQVPSIANSSKTDDIRLQQETDDKNDATASLKQRRRGRPPGAKNRLFVKAARNRAMRSAARRPEVPGGSGSKTARGMKPRRDKGVGVAPGKERRADGDDEKSEDEKSEIEISRDMALESLTALHPEMTSQDGGSSSPEATEVEPIETEDKTEVVTSTSDRELGGYVPGRIDRPGINITNQARTPIQSAPAAATTSRLISSSGIVSLLKDTIKMREQLAKQRAKRASQDTAQAMVAPVASAAVEIMQKPTTDSGEEDGRENVFEKFTKIKELAESSQDEDDAISSKSEPTKVSVKRVGRGRKKSTPAGKDSTDDKKTILGASVVKCRVSAKSATSVEQDSELSQDEDTEAGSRTKRGRRRAIKGEGSSQDGEESSSKGPVEAKAPLGKVVSKEENQDAEETAKEKSEVVEKLQVDKLVDDTIEKQDVDNDSTVDETADDTETEIDTENEADESAHAQNQDGSKSTSGAPERGVIGSKRGGKDRGKGRRNQLDMLMANLVEAYSSAPRGSSDRSAKSNISDTLSTLQLPSGRAARSSVSRQKSEPVATSSVSSRPRGGGVVGGSESATGSATIKRGRGRGGGRGFRRGSGVGQRGRGSGVRGSRGGLTLSSRRGRGRGGWRPGAGRRRGSTTGITTTTTSGVRSGVIRRPRGGAAAFSAATVPKNPADTTTATNELSANEFYQDSDEYGRCSPPGPLDIAEEYVDETTHDYSAAASDEEDEGEGHLSLFLEPEVNEMGDNKDVTVKALVHNESESDVDGVAVKPGAVIATTSSVLPLSKPDVSSESQQKDLVVRDSKNNYDDDDLASETTMTATETDLDISRDMPELSEFEDTKTAEGGEAVVSPMRKEAPSDMPVLESHAIATKAPQKEERVSKATTQSEMATKSDVLAERKPRTKAGQEEKAKPKTKADAKTKPDPKTKPEEKSIPLETRQVGLKEMQAFVMMENDKTDKNKTNSGATAQDNSPTTSVDAKSEVPESSAQLEDGAANETKEDTIDKITDSMSLSDDQVVDNQVNEDEGQSIIGISDKQLVGDSTEATSKESETNKTDKIVSDSNTTTEDKVEKTTIESTESSQYVPNKPQTKTILSKASVSESAPSQVSIDKTCQQNNVKPETLDCSVDSELFRDLNDSSSTVETGKDTNSVTAIDRNAETDKAKTTIPETAIEKSDGNETVMKMEKPSVEDKNERESDIETAKTEIIQQGKQETHQTKRVTQQSKGKDETKPKGDNDDVQQKLEKENADIEVKASVISTAEKQTSAGIPVDSTKHIQDMSPDPNEVSTVSVPETTTNTENKTSGKTQHLLSDDVDVDMVAVTHARESTNQNSATIDKMKTGDSIETSTHRQANTSDDKPTFTMEIETQTGAQTWTKKGGATGQKQTTAEITTSKATAQVVTATQAVQVFINSDQFVRNAETESESDTEVAPPDETGSDEKMSHSRTRTTSSSAAVSAILEATGVGKVVGAKMPEAIVIEEKLAAVIGDGNNEDSKPKVIHSVPTSDLQGTENIVAANERSTVRDENDWQQSDFDSKVQTTDNTEIKTDIIKEEEHSESVKEIALASKKVEASPDEQKTITLTSIEQKTSKIESTISEQVSKDSNAKTENSSTMTKKEENQEPKPKAKVPKELKDIQSIAEEWKPMGRRGPKPKQPQQGPDGAPVKMRRKPGPKPKPKTVIEPEAKSNLEMQPKSDDASNDVTSLATSQVTSDASQTIAATSSSVTNDDSTVTKEPENIDIAKENDDVSKESNQSTVVAKESDPVTKETKPTMQRRKSVPWTKSRMRAHMAKAREIRLQGLAKRKSGNKTGSNQTPSTSATPAQIESGADDKATTSSGGTIGGTSGNKEKAGPGGPRKGAGFKKRSEIELLFDVDGPPSRLKLANRATRKKGHLAVPAGEKKTILGQRIEVGSKRPKMRRMRHWSETSLDSADLETPPDSDAGTTDTSGAPKRDTSGPSKRKDATSGIPRGSRHLVSAMTSSTAGHEGPSKERIEGEVGHDEREITEERKDDYEEEEEGVVGDREVHPDIGSSPDSDSGKKMTTRGKKNRYWYLFAKQDRKGNMKSMLSKPDNADLADYQHYRQAATKPAPSKKPPTQGDRTPPADITRSGAGKSPAADGSQSPVAAFGGGYSGESSSELNYSTGDSTASPSNSTADLQPLKVPKLVLKIPKKAPKRKKSMHHHHSEHKASKHAKQYPTIEAVEPSPESLTDRATPPLISKIIFPPRSGSPAAAAQSSTSGHVQNMQPGASHGNRTESSQAAGSAAVQNRTESTKDTAAAQSRTERLLAQCRPCYVKLVDLIKFLKMTGNEDMIPAMPDPLSESFEEREKAQLAERKATEGAEAQVTDKTEKEGPQPDSEPPVLTQTATPASITPPKTAYEKSFLSFIGEKQQKRFPYLGPGRAPKQLHDDVIDQMNELQQKSPSVSPLKTSTPLKAVSTAISDKEKVSMPLSGSSIKIAGTVDGAVSMATSQVNTSAASQKGHSLLKSSVVSPASVTQSTQQVGFRPILPKVSQLATTSTSAGADAMLNKPVTSSASSAGTVTSQAPATKENGGDRKSIKKQALSKEIAAQSGGIASSTKGPILPKVKQGGQSQTPGVAASGVGTDGSSPPKDGSSPSKSTISARALTAKVKQSGDAAGASSLMKGMVSGTSRKTARKQMKTSNNQKTSIAMGASLATSTTSQSSTGGVVQRYRCLCCTYTCSSKTVMAEHIYNHTDIVPYSCGYCGSIFGTKSGVTVHTKRDHKTLPHKIVKNSKLDEDQYFCTIEEYERMAARGPVPLKTVERMSQSNTQATPKPSHASVARQANSPFATTNSQFATEFSKETLDSLYSSRMTTIKLTQAQPDVAGSATAHETTYQCKFCDFKTSDRKTIEVHVAHTHQKDRRFVCPMCKVSFFKQLDSMKKHIQKWHPGADTTNIQYEPGYFTVTESPSTAKSDSSANASSSAAQNSASSKMVAGATNVGGATVAQFRGEKSSSPKKPKARKSIPAPKRKAEMDRQTTSSPKKIREMQSTKEQQHKIGAVSQKLPSASKSTNYVSILPKVAYRDAAAQMALQQGKQVILNVPSAVPHPVNQNVKEANQKAAANSANPSSASETNQDADATSPEFSLKITNVMSLNPNSQDKPNTESIKEVADSQTPEKDLPGSQTVSSSMASERNTSPEYMCKEISSTSEETETETMEISQNITTSETTTKILETKPKPTKVDVYGVATTNVKTSKKAASNTGQPTLKKCFQCKICSKILENFEMATTHISKNHYIDFEYKCPYCVFTCKDDKVDLMRRHMRTVHRQHPPGARFSIVNQQAFFKLVQVDASRFAKETLSSGDQRKMSAASVATPPSQKAPLGLVEQSRQSNVKQPIAAASRAGGTVIIQQDEPSVINVAGSTLASDDQPLDFSVKPTVQAPTQQKQHVINVSTDEEVLDLSKGSSTSASSRSLPTLTKQPSSSASLIGNRAPPPLRQMSGNTQNIQIQDGVVLSPQVPAVNPRHAPPLLTRAPVSIGGAVDQSASSIQQQQKQQQEQFAPGVIMEEGVSSEEEEEDEEMAREAFSVFNLQPPTSSFMPLNIPQPPPAQQFYASGAIHQSTPLSLANIQDMSAGPHFRATHAPMDHSGSGIIPVGQPPIAGMAHNPQFQVAVPQGGGHNLNRLHVVNQAQMPAHSMASTQGSHAQFISPHPMRRAPPPNVVVGGPGMKHTSGLPSQLSRLVSCPYCAFKNSSYDVMWNHIVSHDNVEWTCPYCPMPQKMAKAVVEKHMVSCHPGAEMHIVPYGLHPQNI